MSLFYFLYNCLFRICLGMAPRDHFSILVTSIAWHSGHTQQHLLDNLILTEAQTHMTCGGEASSLERQVVGE